MSTLQATSSNSKTSMQLERSKKILSQIQTTREVAEQKKAEAAAGGGAGSFAASGGAHGSGQWGAPQGYMTPQQQHFMQQQQWQQHQQMQMQHMQRVQSMQMQQAAAAAPASVSKDGINAEVHRASFVVTERVPFSGHIIRFKPDPKANKVAVLKKGTRVETTRRILGGTGGIVGDWLEITKPCKGWAQWRDKSAVYLRCEMTAKELAARSGTVDDFGMDGTPAQPSEADRLCSQLEGLLAKLEARAIQLENGDDLPDEEPELHGGVHGGNWTIDELRDKHTQEKYAKQQLHLSAASSRGGDLVLPTPRSSVQGGLWVSVAKSHDLAKDDVVKIVAELENELTGAHATIEMLKKQIAGMQGGHSGLMPTYSRNGAPETPRSVPRAAAPVVQFEEAPVAEEAPQAEGMFDSSSVEDVMAHFAGFSGADEMLTEGEFMDAIENIPPHDIAAKSIERLGRIYSLFDANGDGVVDLAELAEGLTLVMYGGVNEKGNVAMLCALEADEVPGSLSRSEVQKVFEFAGGVFSDATAPDRAMMSGLVDRCTKATAGAADQFAGFVERDSTARSVFGLDLPQQYAVDAAKINVRDVPTTDGTRLTVLEKGTVVEVLSWRQDWANVRFGPGVGKVGWALGKRGGKKYIKKVSL